MYVSVTAASSPAVNGAPTAGLTNGKGRPCGAPPASGLAATRHRQS